MGSEMCIRDRKKQISKRFKMGDEGEVHYILGMAINRNRNDGVLTIDQHAFLSSMLKRFGMDDCKPVAKYSSIRTVLAIANQLDLDLHQMDVKTAFLNGDLEEEIYFCKAARRLHR